MRRIGLLLALLAAFFPTALSATAWGTLQILADREWTTEKEPRPRVTKFRWVEPGKVLEARHGFVSRLQFGEAKFADTVQRFVLDPKTGAINVTYTYEDGRPPLKAVIKVQPDGSLIETFTDAKGVKKRNIYKSPTPSVNAIERQEMKGGAWASLGTTRKAGLTQFEIAENKRRAEQARQTAIAQENARRAAEQARRDAEARQQAAYEQQQAEYAQQEQSMQQNMPNMLDVLNGMANSINQETQRQQVQFEQRMRADQSGGSSSGGSSSGAITVGSSSSPTVDYASSAPPAASTPAQPSTYYWYCYGQIKKRGTAPGESDQIDTIFYGTVTSAQQDIHGATDLFRQHTRSDNASDTESPGAWCSPASSQAEAGQRISELIARDGSKWRQVTGINLTM